MALIVGAVIVPRVAVILPLAKNKFRPLAMFKLLLQVMVPFEVCAVSESVFKESTSTAGADILPKKLNPITWHTVQGHC